MTPQSVQTDGPSILDTPQTKAIQTDDWEAHLLAARRRQEEQPSLPAIRQSDKWSLGLFAGFVNAWAEDPAGLDRINIGLDFYTRPVREDRRLVEVAIVADKDRLWNRIERAFNRAAKIG